MKRLKFCPNPEPDPPIDEDPPLEPIPPKV